MHTFTCTPDPENPYDHVKVTVETKTPMLAEVVSAFKSYLKAAGFVFEGNLDFVDEYGEPLPKVNLHDTLTGSVGSQYVQHTTNFGEEV